MKIAAILLAALLLATVSQAQLQPQDASSAIQFRIKNLGFNVTGTLGGLGGTIRFDPAQPEGSAIDVSVDAATVNTDNGMRDDHLRQASFFDVQHFPRIRLVATKIQLHKRGSYLFTGQLSIKGHTKEIAFPFTVAETGGGYRFHGSFTLNRRDFELGGFSTISDELEVTLDILAK